VLAALVVHTTGVVNEVVVMLPGTRLIQPPPVAEVVDPLLQVIGIA